jgi:metal-responsive CopG/Arc/MetJ family transcriptional regulator
MYSGVVERTQIYLGVDEIALLDRIGRATGASRSELIRRAVRHTFGERSKTERLAALEASAGSLSRMKQSGEDFVEGVRGDLNERLASLGLR